MTIKPGCEVTCRSSVSPRHTSNGNENSTALPVVAVVAALWVKTQSQVDERSDLDAHT